MSQVQFKPEAQAQNQSTTYVKAKDLAKGQVVATGRFAGLVPNQFDADKPSVKITTPTDEAVIINAAGNLLKQLEYKEVKVGDVVQITYTGTKPIVSENKKLNGKLAHQFKVVKGTLE